MMNDEARSILCNYMYANFAPDAEVVEGEASAGGGAESGTSASLESLCPPVPLETVPNVNDAKGLAVAATDPNDEKAVNGFPEGTVLDA